MRGLDWSVMTIGTVRIDQSSPRIFFDGNYIHQCTDGREPRTIGNYRPKPSPRPERVGSTCIRGRKGAASASAGFKHPERQRRCILVYNRVF